MQSVTYPTFFFGPISTLSVLSDLHPPTSPPSAQTPKTASPPHVTTPSNATCAWPPTCSAPHLSASSKSTKCSWASLRAPPATTCPPHPLLRPHGKPLMAQSPPTSAGPARGGAVWVTREVTLRGDKWMTVVTPKEVTELISEAKGGSMTLATVLAGNDGDRIRRGWMPHRGQQGLATWLQRMRVASTNFPPRSKPTCVAREAVGRSSMTV